MTSYTNWTLAFLAGFAAIAAAGEASAIDRSVGAARKVKAATEQVDDGLYIAARPELFAGKPVRIFCERLRNPSQGSMSCRSNGTSIVVDTGLLGADALRHAFENCQGMTSTCSGMVSGVVEFTKGVAHIVKADVEFSQD